MIINMIALCVYINGFEKTKKYVCVNLRGKLL